MKMKKLILLAGTALCFATPAAAVDLGLAVGSGQSASTSLPSSSSQGSSASLIFGATQQSSAGIAASGGSATSIMSGNDQSSTSVHQSETLQEGQTTSFGLAGSQNSNVTGAVGGSAASNSLQSIWIFLQP